MTTKSTADSTPAASSKRKSDHQMNHHNEISNNSNLGTTTPSVSKSSSFFGLLKNVASPALSMFGISAQSAQSSPTASDNKDRTPSGNGNNSSSASMMEIEDYEQELQIRDQSLLSKQTTTTNPKFTSKTKMHLESLTFAKSNIPKQQQENEEQHGELTAVQEKVSSRSNNQSSVTNYYNISKQEMSESKKSLNLTTSTDNSNRPTPSFKFSNPTPNIINTTTMSAARMTTNSSSVTEKKKTPVKQEETQTNSDNITQFKFDEKLQEKKSANEKLADFFAQKGSQPLSHREVFDCLNLIKGNVDESAQSIFSESSFMSDMQHQQQVTSQKGIENTNSFSKQPIFQFTAGSSGPKVSGQNQPKVRVKRRPLHYFGAGLRSRFLQQRRERKEVIEEPYAVQATFKKARTDTTTLSSTSSAAAHGKNDVIDIPSEVPRSAAKTSGAAKMILDVLDDTPITTATKTNMAFKNIQKEYENPWEITPQPVSRVADITVEKSSTLAGNFSSNNSLSTTTGSPASNPFKNVFTPKRPHEIPIPQTPVTQITTPTTNAQISTAKSAFSLAKTAFKSVVSTPAPSVQETKKKFELETNQPSDSSKTTTMFDKPTFKTMETSKTFGFQTQQSSFSSVEQPKFDIESRLGGFVVPEKNEKDRKVVDSMEVTESEQITGDSSISKVIEKVKKLSDTELPSIDFTLNADNVPPLVIQAFQATVVNKMQDKELPTMDLSLKIYCNSVELKSNLGKDEKSKDEDDIIMISSGKEEDDEEDDDYEIDLEERSEDEEDDDDKEEDDEDLLEEEDGEEDDEVIDISDDDEVMNEKDIHVQNATEVGSFIKPTSTSTSKWTCSICLVDNQDSHLKCVCCENDKPGAAKTNVGSTPAAVPAFDWGEAVPSTTPNALKNATKKNKWDCPICMIKNDDAVLKCLACEADKPGSQNAAPSKAEFSLGASTRNAPSAANSTSSNSLSSFNWGAASASVTSTKKGKWECTTCLVSNDESATQCIACETEKPGLAVSEKKDLKTSSSTAGGFTFGSTSNTSSSVGGFTFGSRSTTTTSVTNPAPVTFGSSTGTPGFTFGSSGNSSAFTFGSATTAFSTPKKPSSSFGGIGSISGQQSSNFTFGSNSSSMNTPDPKDKDASGATSKITFGFAQTPGFGGSSGTGFQFGS